MALTKCKECGGAVAGQWRKWRPSARIAEPDIRPSHPA